MRVIAGDRKGRQLTAVPGQNTRPTGDKIKEAIFHKLGPFFQGGTCLDLFSGSGSMGIEALSRGMDKAIFIDVSNPAIQTVHKNIALLKLEDYSEIYRNDAFRALAILEAREIKVDLIILDPPYEKVDYHKLLEKVVNSNIMNDGCSVYCEHGKSITFTEEVAPLTKTYEKKYNDTTFVTLFQN